MRSRAGVILAVAVAGLVLLAGVAAIVSATRPEPQFPAGSPEAVVQDYVRAVYDGDLDDAAEHLDPGGRCTVEDLRAAYVADDVRVVLRDVEVDGEEADVQVELVHGEAGPFGGSEWAEEHQFRLVDDGGRWVITGEPWPMYGCLASDEVSR